MEKSNKYEAGAQFAKAQRANDAKKATSEYETAAKALRAKTERLRALRLARDAAAPPQPPPRQNGEANQGHIRHLIGLARRPGQRGSRRLIEKTLYCGDPTGLRLSTSRQR